MRQQKQQSCDIERRAASKAGQAVGSRRSVALHVSYTSLCMQPVPASSCIHNAQPSIVEKCLVIQQLNYIGDKLPATHQDNVITVYLLRHPKRLSITQQQCIMARG
jgi:hypothetical protein